MICILPGELMVTHMKYANNNFSKRGNDMRMIQRSALATLAAAMLIGLNGCAGMSAQDKSTAIGAGVGAVQGVLG